MIEPDKTFTASQIVFWCESCGCTRKATECTIELSDKDREEYDFTCPVCEQALGWYYPTKQDKEAGSK